MKRFHWMLVAVVLVPGWALAQEGEEPAASGATFEVLDAKICGGVEGKEAADVKSTFAVGEKAWLWMKVKPEGEATMQLRWSLDGTPVFTMDPVPARLGRLWYYKTLHKPGDWTVEVLDASENVVHSGKFTVTGEAAGPSAKAPAPEPAAGEPAASEPAAAGESGRIEVVEFKLAEKIEDRNPVGVGTEFSQGGRVYSWMKLKVSDPETTIKLRWSLGDTVMHTTDPVTVRQSSAWRTWLYKTVSKSGDWKVELLDADDNSVHAENFTVK